VNSIDEIGILIVIVLIREADEPPLPQDVTMMVLSAMLGSSYSGQD
jgi:hypothetical protein